MPIIISDLHLENWPNHNVRPFHRLEASFEILEECKKNTNMDFNDLIIAKSAVSNNLKLLTDDKDMSTYPNIKLVHC